MTSKERLQATLNHKDPGKVVIDFGTTGVTGIHVQAVENLRKYYGLPYQPVKVTEPYQMLGEIDNDLADAMGIDTIGLPGRNNMFGFENKNWKEYKTFWGQVVQVPNDFKTKIDDNGDLLIFPEGDTTSRPSAKMPKGSYFFDTIIRQGSIDESKLDPADNLEEFKPLSIEDIQYWSALANRYRNSDKGIVATFGGTAIGDIALVPGPFMKNPKGIRDIAEWYMSTLLRSDYVHSIFEKQTEIALSNLQILNSIVGDIIDVVFLCGTDFGTQDSQFCSKEGFDELYKPYYQKMNEWIHRNTSWKTFKHSCGAVEPLIPSFIDAGFDILNPVQINALGMDPQNLKEKYGDQIVFWGGGVDTQIMLPFKSPSEVRDHVLMLCDIFGKGGGFVFNTVHNIQANVPIANIVAMVDAVKEFKGKG